MRPFFKLLLITQLFSLFLLFASAPVVQAAEVKFKPQVTIPQSSTDKELNLTKGQTTDLSTFKSTEPIALYIRAIYKYAIGVVGILATVVMMFGGIMWLTAGGNQTRIGEAKAWIGASLTGLVIALCSYLILATVNPALVNLNVKEIQELNKPKDIGTNTTCCHGACQFKNQKDCELYRGVWYVDNKYAFRCEDNKCIKTNILGTCQYSTDDWACLTSSQQNGYCENHICKPCLKKGDTYPYKLLKVGVIRCMGPDGLCGNGHPGDSSCDPIKDICTCE